MMNNNDNKRIAKNTVFLYIRMLLLILVTFYTTRVILEALGVNDFGLYNVVAGFVSMMAFINTSLSNSIQRFLNCELGKGSKGLVSKYFAVSLTSQLLVSFFILLFAETFGIWFLNEKMNIPENRALAANLVFQMSVLSLIVKILQAPFSALIIAKEKMQFYAYVTLLEVLLQLIVAYIMLLELPHKLELYSFFLLLVVLLTFVCSVCYSYKIQVNLSLKPAYDKTIFREVYSFCGWNLFGSSSGVLMNQGVNILINMFFGVAVNAARGISFQVIAGVQRFIGSFQLAVNPQIVQSYASGSKERYLNLCYVNYKISFYLMWLLTLPLLLTCRDVLQIWLHKVPENAVDFVNVSLLCGLVEALASAISVPMYATGKIKSYQIIVSLIKVASLPAIYYLFMIGYSPISSLYICLIFDIIAQLFRVLIWAKLVKTSFFLYVRRILVPACFVVVVTFVLCHQISQLYHVDSVFFRVVASIATAVALNILFIFLLGLNSHEKYFLCKNLKSKILWRKK